MSADNNNTSKGNNSNKNVRLATLAGILAFGLLASSLVGSQMLNLAVAQTSNGGRERTVTSIDDIDCDKVKSAVHCVVDTVVAEPKSSTNTSELISAPSYHGTSTVSTSGTTMTKVRPDKFSVTVGVETNGTTAEEAASNNAELIAAVIAALRDLGIAEDEISASQYNIYPVYSRSDPVTVDRNVLPNSTSNHLL